MAESPEKGAKYLFIFFGILIIIAIGIIVWRSGSFAEEETYNGFVVTPVQVGRAVVYKVEVFINDEGPYILNAHFPPDEVDVIPVDAGVREYVLTKNEIIAATDVNDPRISSKVTIAALDVNYVLENLYSIPVHSGSTSPHEDFQLVSCADATPLKGIIIFEIGEENRVVLDGSCVRVQAVSDADLVKVATRLNYALVSVIP